MTGKSERTDCHGKIKAASQQTSEMTSKMLEARREGWNRFFVPSQTSEGTNATTP